MNETAVLLDTRKQLNVLASEMMRVCDNPDATKEARHYAAQWLCDLEMAQGGLFDVVLRRTHASRLTHNHLKIVK